MTVSFQANAPTEWKYPLGSDLVRLSNDRLFVVVGHALGMDREADFQYVLVDSHMMLVNWVLSADEVHDQFKLVAEPTYSVARFNPTTWSVVVPATGDNGLKHVVAQCDSLVAAERVAVTMNLTRNRHA